MLGNNELRKQELGDGDALEVVEMFSTIQGEGPLAGEPAFFIRLAGCNLNCSFCDTDFESNAKTISVNEIANEVLNAGLRHVVITGGEPFRQQIVPLMQRLISLLYHVSVETSGSLFIDEYEELVLQYGRSDITLVCSPKTGKVSFRLIPYVDAWKYILKAGEVSKDDGLPCVLPCGGKVGKVYRPEPGAPIFVQPCDEGEEHSNKTNCGVVVESAMKFGYRVSFQIHKALNLR